MATTPNGFWDFKSYDQNTWFRFLIWKMALLLILYILLHVFCYRSSSNYEYSRLNDEQKLFIGRLFADPPSVSTPGSGSTPPSANAPAGANTQQARPSGGSAGPNTNAGAATNQPATDTAQKDTAKNRQPAVAATQQNKDKALSLPVAGSKAVLAKSAMDYLDNIFENKLDPVQAKQLKGFLEQAKPQDAAAFLNGTRFRVHSYFWLVGPSVYWEVYIWSIFGVLSSLFFALGTVNSNATTDLGNSKSQFDGSEIYGQIAKLFYAPLCTLSVLFGYNYFKDQNIVDISSSKGILAFGFIAGFYSSRIIALMDRLKEVLLPNSGSTTLPVAGASVTPVNAVTVQLKPDPELPKDVLTALGDTGLNTAAVLLKALGTANEYKAGRKDTDANASFTAVSVLPGRYTITADLTKTLADNSVLHLSASLEGQILSGGSPIVLMLKKTN